VTQSYNELPREQGYVHGECPEALRMDEFVAYLRTAQHQGEENWTDTSEPFIFVDGYESSPSSLRPVVCLTS
jgi:hypothetical protein